MLQHLPKITFLTIALFVGYLLLSSHCVPKKVVGVKGFFLNQPFENTVDNTNLKTWIEKNDFSVLQKKYDTAALNNQLLVGISKQYSPDVATFYAVNRWYEMPENKALQNSYQSFLQSNDLDFQQLSKYKILFVAGFAYKSDTTTGADFGKQRRLLTKYGINNELIEIDEWGLVDDNARMIVEKIKAEKEENILLVSASKGGLETALALDLLTETEAKNIKAWISVGGILRGSPIANQYLKAPKCWFAALMLKMKGKNINIVRDISYNQRAAAFEKLTFSKHIKIIHLVGSPLATHISKEIRGRYCSLLKQYGPNDGLTTLCDQVTEHGYIVSEIGLDHYFRDKNIDLKTLALAQATVKILEK